ncbi:MULTISPECIES: DUF397 domain-containing protein [unclassified Actinomadura]|uniref:DUF397 domain-containing protein n=1 Tax=unclassified Actinomadura TaxID=2626254 RepID=UPI0011EE7D0E|nr:DUF397 domain-containing protein [Actinomadura sp. K4S16]
MVYRSNRGAALNWRKSSASTGGQECVEVAAAGQAVLVRDSRDISAGFLALAPAQWKALLAAIRDGGLERR